MTPDLQILIELAGWLLAIFGVAYLVEIVIYGRN